MQNATGQIVRGFASERSTILGVDRTVLVLDTMTKEGVEGGAVGLVKRLGAG